MNIVILTSNSHRHKYFANEVSKRLNVVGVVSEESSFEPFKYANSANEQDIIKKHFDLREKEEAKSFADSFDTKLDILRLKKGNINNNQTLEFLKNKNIDYIFVYGTGLIKENIISAYPNKIINMHLGLSPYYRGAGTNFWPIVENTPQYCGVSIHFLDYGIDSGNLIARGRAQAFANDNIHSFGNRIIKVGTKLICGCIKNIFNNHFQAIKQDLSKGRIYYKKDFNADMLQKAYDNIKNGLFENYALTQNTLLKEVPIVSI